MLANPLQVEGELYSRQLAVAHDSWRHGKQEHQPLIPVDFHWFPIQFPFPEGDVARMCRS